MPDGMYYNVAYPGNLIAMPQPIYGEDVTYADGAPTDVSAIASDLVYFPYLDCRTKLGKTKTHRSKSDDILVNHGWHELWRHEIYLGGCKKSINRLVELTCKKLALVRLTFFISTMFLYI